jgi:predicted small secreted protein
MRSRNLVLLTILAATMAISACNTVSGAGKDVKSAGKAVTDTAEDAKK